MKKSVPQVGTESDTESRVSKARKDRTQRHIGRKKESGELTWKSERVSTSRKNTGEEEEKS